MYFYDTKFLGLKENEKQTYKKESIQFVKKKKNKNKKDDSRYRTRTRR